MTNATMPDSDATLGTSSARAGLAGFFALVLADATLQARLGVIERPDAYIAETVAIAAAHAIALDADDLAAIRAAIRPDPLGLGRWLPSPVTRDGWPAKGWLPARAVQGTSPGDPPGFDWAWFGPQPLDAPFYAEAVQRFASRPFNLMFRTRTSLADLVAGAETAAAPAGFIHHMSRCGSTLIAQMLGADPHLLGRQDNVDLAILSFVLIAWHRIWRQWCEHVRASRSARSRTDQHGPGLPLYAIDIAPLFCAPVCVRTDTSGRPLYFDNAHLTLTGADRVEPALVSSLRTYPVP